MSRVNLKRHNRVHSPSSEPDILVEAESKVSILSDEHSSIGSDMDSSTGLRKKEKIKSATTLNMAEKLKRSRMIENLKLESSELTKSFKMMHSRLSAHDNSSALRSGGFTFIDELIEIPNLNHTNDETMEDLVELSLSPERLLFQQKLSEKECFVSNVSPLKTSSPVSLRCFKPDYHEEKVTEYVPAWNTNQNQLKEVVVDEENLLQLSFQSVKFLHHPLFSLEHFLINQLQELYQKFKKFDIGQCRSGKKLRKCLMHQVKLQKNILKVWLEVKRLRKEQNYYNTALRLAISTEPQQTYSQLYDSVMLHQDDEACNIDDPVLDFILVRDELSEAKSLNEEESLRRKVVETTKFSLKIWCDGVLVAKSDPHYLNQDFELDFCQTFPIRLTQMPNWFTVELYEHPKGLLKKKIADFKIDLPSNEQVYNDAKWLEKEFERREIVHYKHAGIGSGFILSDVNALKALKLTGSVYTRGLLTYKIGWLNTISNQKHQANNCVFTELRNTIDRWHCVDRSALQRLLEDDLHRNNLVDFGLNLDTCNQVDYFRLNPNLDGLVSFCRPEDLNRNIRLKYLKLRDQHEIEFAHIPIPNRVRELPFSLIRDFEMRKKRERETYQQIADTSEVRDAGENVETSRANKLRRLKQYYTNVFRVCESLEDNMTYDSVVDEKYLIYFEDVIRTCLTNALNWFRWRPKIAAPLPRLAELKQTNHEPPSKVLVKILEVKNLLLRSEGEIKPLVEVCFDSWRLKVSLADCRGRDSWTFRDEVVVELPLKYSQVDCTSPDSFSGYIDIHLLDDVSTPNIEKYVWLGTVKIPLAALISTYQLCGWFLVHTPCLITEYSSYQNDATSKRGSMIDTCTYLRLEVKIAPSLPCIQPDMANLPSNDPPYIRDHVIKWNKSFNARFSNRSFNVLALDIRGRTSCITRFLKPFGPPQLNFSGDFDVTPEQCLQYVSLIPFTDCQGFYNNIWLTSEQLIEFSIGSVIDHCVTLVCFLLALKLEAYLILGYGIPNGLTSYVLLMEQSVCHLLDVTYNRIYDFNDPFCPLQKLFCVVGCENVWGNVQRTSNVQLLRFDFKRKSDWWPLFDVGQVAPFPHVVDVSTSSDCAITSGDQLESILEQKLKRKFARWRSTVKTNFNQRIITKSWCRQQLKILENNKSTFEALSEIKKILQESNVEATIIHSPFTSSHSIIKKVKRLEMHVQPQTVTEFLLNVYVQPYPGSVFSVWILIGALQCK